MFFSIQIFGAWLFYTSHLPEETIETAVKSLTRNITRKIKLPCFQRRKKGAKNFILHHQNNTPAKFVLFYSTYNIL